MKHPVAAALPLFFALTFVAFAGSTAQAQAIRFISTTGNDASICSLTAPCRNLQRGINATPVGGELRILDSGGYGVQGIITKSMTISGEGNTLLMGSSPAIRVNSGTAIVTLRGLHLNGRGQIADGIRVDAAAAVHIADCKLERFTQNGINLNGNSGGGPASQFHVTDTTSSDNAYTGLVALGIFGPTTLTIDNSVFENNTEGVRILNLEASITNSAMAGNAFVGMIQDGGRSTVAWTTAAQNGTHGFSVDTSGDMTLEFSTARGNSLAGLNVGSAGDARISNSTFTDNGTGIQNDGTVETRENNTVAGNTTADVSDQGALVSLPPI